MQVAVSVHAVQPDRTDEQATQVAAERAYPGPHLHPFAPSLTKCPTVLHVVHTAGDVHVEHPVICDPQVLQVDPVSVYPLLQAQIPPVLLKKPVTSQVLQLVAELHVRHPGILEAQVTHCAENRA